MKSAIIALCTVGLVNAGSKDSCEPGSDSVCARFGTNMCCAHVQYTFRGDSQDFYSCASKPGIEYSQGFIYDSFGFQGTWYCANASYLAVTAALATATLSLI